MRGEYVIVAERGNPIARRHRVDFYRGTDMSWRTARRMAVSLMTRLPRRRGASWRRRDGRGREVQDLDVVPDHILAYASTWAARRSATSRSRSPPEPCDHEVVVERQCLAAPHRLHDREAHGIGIGDSATRQSSHPLARAPVMLARGVNDGEPSARVDTIQQQAGRARPKTEQRQPVSLGEDEVGGDQGDSPFDRRPKPITASR